jgi:hypothetical protein
VLNFSIRVSSLWPHKIAHFVNRCVRVFITRVLNLVENNKKTAGDLNSVPLKRWIEILAIHKYGKRPQGEKMIV